LDWLAAGLLVLEMDLEKLLVELEIPVAICFSGALI
jgi:hypothetical protein